MKLELFGEKKKPDDVLRLKLFTHEDGVVLHAVDEEGNKLPRSAIFLIRHDGTGCLPLYIGVDIPVQKTHNGALKLKGS